ncbi:MAG TPA: formylmethanofuran dehydrogenase subunit B [Pirellulales bacterium]|jgi:formylmethanofuran dehydrogenase subunit B|nr:formylmethanofuran dehydrogenase subunit B [Pirellulales bacterium]
MSSPAKAQAPEKSRLTVIEDAVCVRCGCACDDITLVAQDDRIREARNACELGDRWLLADHQSSFPLCRIDGQEATIEEGVERAARVLLAAKYPLVYGLADTTCEAQRVAVGIADWIGGTVDTPTSHSHGPWGVAFQGVGEVTSSLGEIANRGDLVIFWGSNPVVTHPRHLSRYSLEPQGMFLPGGQQDRTCVVVDVRATETAELADLFICIEPGKDFEALWILRGLAQGTDFDGADVLAATGVPLATWQDLMARMKQARFGVILFGMGLTATSGKHLNSEAMLALVKDMNAYTRFVARPMRERGNIAGADNVLSWRTGFPFGVNLSRGYPRFNPGEYTAMEMLSRCEADAALIVGADPASESGPLAQARLTEIPTVVLSPTDTATARGAGVWFATAEYSIFAEGTVYRMDDVPLPLRPALANSRPSDFDVLSAIERRVCELKRVGSALNADDSV